MHYISKIGFNHLSETEIKQATHTLSLYGASDPSRVDFIRSSQNLLTYQFTSGKSLIFGSIKTSSVTGFHSQNHKRESISGLLWCLLALVLAIAMYFILDNQILKIIGAGILAFMAVYLLFDFLKQRSGNELVITTTNGEVRIPCGRPLTAEEVHGFLTNTLQPEDEELAQYGNIGRIFTPR